MVWDVELFVPFFFLLYLFFYVLLYEYALSYGSDFMFPVSLFPTPLIPVYVAVFAFFVGDVENNRS